MNIEVLQKKLRITDPQTRDFFISTLENEVYTQLSAENLHYWYLFVCYCLTDSTLPSLADACNFKTRDTVTARVRYILKLLWEMHPSFIGEQFEFNLERRRLEPKQEPDGEDSYMRRIFDLSVQGLTVDDMVEEVGDYKIVENCVKLIRKNYNKDFMRGELRNEVKRARWEELDVIFYTSTNKLLLGEAFEDVTLKYLMYDKKRKEKRLFSMREIARLSYCYYSGPSVRKMVLFLQEKGIFVGVHTEKRAKNSDAISRQYLVTRTFKDEAVELLKNSDFPQVMRVIGKNSGKLPTISEFIADPSLIQVSQVIDSNLLSLIDDDCPVAVFFYNQEAKVASKHVSTLSEYLKRKLRMRAALEK